VAAGILLAADTRHREGNMRTWAIIIGVLAFAIPTIAEASCFGSQSFQNCYDGSGNQYTVQRFGNQTIVNGNNWNTGSSWSQRSTSYGNMTIHNGTAGNGNSWNMIQRNYGGMSTYSGTDSNGNYFNYTCGTWGCN
jgi:hypothetical protein